MSKCEVAAASSGNLYGDLSGYYDQFCAQVDYSEQCAFARRAFTCFAESGGMSYLDLACGTGQHLAYMHEQGFAVSGLDNSAQMLELAAARCPSAELLLCDLAAFEQVEAFDLVTCFLYSIHYSHPLTALAQTLRCAYRALKPGGILLFNTVDARGIRNDNGIVTEVADGAARLRFQSGWTYRGEGDELRLDLSITRDTASGRDCWRDTHCMTATTLPQLQEMLEKTGFVVTLLEHDYQAMRPLQDESFNAIVVAAKG